MKNDMNEQAILLFLQNHPQSSRKEIAEGIHFEGSDATLKRQLSALVEAGNIQVIGQGKATCYGLTHRSILTMPIDIGTYFLEDQDARQIRSDFNFSLLSETLPASSLFTEEEMAELNEMQSLFRQNMLSLSPSAYRKEMERLGVDLSWKSSQIEGNTYSLLETERLLRESKTADGKTHEEAVMLLNHKYTLRFLLDNKDYLQALSVRRIEDVQSLLVKGLDTETGLRRRRVGITGTNYRPLDNEFQIREALEETCTLINGRKNVFEKALLSLLLISYIQPFTDGNKRTSRLVCNGILMANDYCPISFRTVDSIDYKKAMLVFYEQNNIVPFKEIFVSQYRFAVGEYF